MYMERYSSNLLKENLKGELLRFLKFDLDNDGSNGEEYLWEEAKEFGYETNNNYIVDSVISKYGLTKKAVKKAILFVLESSSYYTTHELEVTENERSFSIILKYNHQG